MASRLVSRSGNPPQTPNAQQRQSSSVSCNRCRKSLSTTVFVCACDCIFCEECTYDHFNSSTLCPSCGKSLDTEDFIELCVADPSSSSQEIVKHTLQNMLTKFSPNSKSLSYQEMCTRILKTLDSDRRAVRFLLKQCVFDSTNQIQKSGNVKQAFEKLKHDFTLLKQASSSQRIQAEQTIAELQNRIQALSKTNEELQKSAKDKDKMIAQFRDMYANNGRKQNPPSSYSDSSVRKRARDHTGRDATMQDFMIQEERREREKENAYEQMTRPRNRAISHSHSIEEPSITPIQFSQRPHSIGSAGSSIGQVSAHIRDMTSASGYVFTNRPPHTSKRRRSSDVSPTNAFAFNNHGSSSHFPRNRLHR